MAITLSLRTIGRITVTAVAVAGAAVAGWYLWRHYEVEPWTRDGRVRANVVQLAPDVSGQVTKVHVHDNQLVKAGDLLFEIDRARFELALRQAEAAELTQRTALAQAVKMREHGEARVDQVRATLAQAIIAHDIARLNFDRTQVVAAVNGYVTNLELHTGAYVTAGHAVMALVDRDSFYVEGYFEETKLSRIHVGDRATVRLMGEKRTLNGHVESFAGGIVDRDRSTGSNLLSNINPTFNWVRLAQRIPVRIALDPAPADVRLIAGQTATVEVLDAKSASR